MSRSRLDNSHLTDSTSDTATGSPPQGSHRWTDWKKNSLPADMLQTPLLHLFSVGAQQGAFVKSTGPLKENTACVSFLLPGWRSEKTEILIWNIHLKTRSRWGSRTPDNPWILTNEIKLTLSFHIQHDRKSKCLLLLLPRMLPSCEPHKLSWSLIRVQINSSQFRTKLTSTHICIATCTDEGLLGNRCLHISCQGCSFNVFTVLLATLWFRIIHFEFMKSSNVPVKNVRDPPTILSEAKAWAGFDQMIFHFGKMKTINSFFLLFFVQNHTSYSYLKKSFVLTNSTCAVKCRLSLLTHQSCF